MSSQQNIVLPLPPSEVDFQNLDHLGVMPQFSSLIDAIASMLGYELPPSIPAPARAEMKPKATHKHEEEKVVVPETTGSSVIPPPTKSAESVEDTKPAAKSAAKSQSSNISTFLDDLSDDDSIPDAVVFASSK